MGTRDLIASQMRRAEYLETEEAQSRLHFERLMRRMRFKIEQAPQSKNIHASDAISFQEAVVTSMAQKKRIAYRGAVFLRMRFFNNAPTPPSIQRLAKNYLDLLEKPKKGLDTRRTGLLYYDDRQVKALSVEYNLTPGAGDSGPRIEVEAESLADFTADAALISRIQSNDFRERAAYRSRRSSSSEGFERGPFHDENARWNDDDDFERLNDLRRNRSSWIETVGQPPYDAMEAGARLHVQMQQLERTDRFICDGLLGIYRRTRRDSSEATLAELSRIVRDQRFGSPFVLDLHHVPHKDGDTASFKRAVRSAIATYKERHPWFFPLSTLLTVTIGVVPPAGHAKDLDNLAQLIVPTVHEILQPPSDLLRTLSPSHVPDEHREWYAERLRALPKEPQSSIVQYRAFELPRYPGDRNEGFVRLAIGGGHHRLDFRFEIDQFIDRWKQNIR